MQFGGEPADGDIPLCLLPLSLVTEVAGVGVQRKLAGFTYKSLKFNMHAKQLGRQVIHWPLIPEDLSMSVNMSFSIA